MHITSIARRGAHQICLQQDGQALPPSKDRD